VGIRPAEPRESKATRAALAAIPRRRWTRAEFHRALTLGVFRPDERLELIGGELVEKMSPQESPHATSIRLVEEALRVAFPSGHDVRVQLPLTLGEDSEPEPDVAVVVGSIRDFEEHHPTSAVLVVEVADSSLRTDRGTKAGLYAAAGIADYWIVNLIDRVLEIHRDPAGMADKPFGHHYRSITRHDELARVSPSAAAVATVHVADLLPRASAAR
jgi:Uma2 family endonuclease